MSQFLSWALNRILLLPPFLKGRISIGIGKVFLRKIKPTSYVTNLGISKKLRVRFQGDVLPNYLFGKPMRDRNECGALEVCRAVSRVCDSFLDFGAHRGYFTFYVHNDQPKLPIYYFEPIPFLFEEIEKNVSMNGLENVRGVRAAVGAKVGSTKFYISKKSLVSSSLTLEGMPEGGFDAIDTEILTFDAVAQRYQFKNACVKVDVENAEFDFLEGAAQEKSRIAFFIVEVLQVGHERKFPLHVMKELGMRAYYINGLTLEPSADGAFSYSLMQLNWLFCRQTPTELRELFKGTGLSVRDS